MDTLDTNAIIYYLQDDPRAVPILQGILDDPAIPVYISAVTEAELFSFPSLTDDEAQRICGMVSDLPKLSSFRCGHAFIRAFMPQGCSITSPPIGNVYQVS